MANENSVFSASAPLVSPAPEPSGNPLDTSRLDAVINRATGQPQPDASLPTITPFIPAAQPITLPEGTEYQEAGGPISLPEGTEYLEAPKNLTEAHNLGQPFNPITDFDAAGLADAAKQKAFNPVDLYIQSPLEVQQDPTIRDKVADAFMQTWEYSEKHPTEGISVGSVAKAIGHLGKGIFNWAKNHIDAITSGAGGDKNDARTKAAENILELQLAGTQLGYQGEDLAKWLARRVFKENIVKPLSSYTPEEKDKALQDEIDRRKLTQRILSGKTLKGADKLGLNPEKIASMAGADPLQFLAFEGAGAAAKTVGKLVPEIGEAGQALTEAASKAAPKVAGAAIKGVGKAAEVAVKPIEAASKLAESTVGEYLAAHLLGPPGVIAAKAIGKAGKALPKIAKAGTAIGEQLGEGVTSNTAQAVKDIMEAAPYSLKDILSGAAYDAAFAASAKSPEEREGIGLGTALGLGGGISRLAIHGIGGQLVGERKGAFLPKDAQVFHDIYNTGYEHHQFADATAAQAGLEKLGLSPEQAADFSTKRGGTFETPQGKFTYAVGPDATPHEPVHAWKKSLPVEEQNRLDKETRSRYSDDEFAQIKDNYASQLDPKNFDGTNADEILKQASPGESPDAYTINEIQAENLMTALKAGEGKGLLHKAAKIAAGALSAVGVEPLATRKSQSEALEFPLKHKEVQGLKTALAESKPPGGEGIAAEKAAARNVEGLAEKFPDKAAAIGTLGEAQSRGSGVKLTYAAAPGETPEDIQSASPLVGRKARAAAVEAARELPTWARNPWWKTFFPDRTFATKKGKLQTGGWAPEIFQANAYRYAKEAAPHDAMRALSPYEIDKSTGFYTPDAWKQLTEDTQTAVKNWRDGRTASGTPVVVPEELSKQSGGQIYQPRVGPGGGPLDQAKADFISHLMGHQLPETPRLAKSFPLNVAGQDVSAATIPGRVGGPSRGEFGTYGQSPEEMVSQRERAESMGVEGRQLLEVNPFRLKLDAAAKAAGVKSPKPLSVYQKLNHERILRIEHATGEPEFRGNTLTQAAGFEPSPEDDWREFNSKHKNRVLEENQDLSSSSLKKLFFETRDYLVKSLPGKPIYRAVFSSNPDEKNPGSFWTLDKSIADSWSGKTQYGPKNLESGPRKILTRKVDLKDVDLPSTIAGQLTSGEGEVTLRNNRFEPIKSPFVNEAALTDKERNEYYSSLGQKVPPRESTQSAEFEPSKDWTIEIPKGSKFSKTWILPDGSPVQLGSQFHHTWLNQNPEVAKRFGLKDFTSDEENRVAALKKGFARVNYSINGGDLTIEARSKDWPNLQESIKRLVASNAGKIDFLGVTLFNDGVTKPDDIQHVKLMDFSSAEKSDHIPFISEPTETTTFSAQATAARFEPTTISGQEAEKKGYAFEKKEGKDGARYLFRDREGNEVSHIQIVPDFQNKNLAWVDDTVTSPPHQRQGLAEALYREAATDLQRKGIKLLGGLTMNEAPRQLRQKLFGAPIKETPLVSAIPGNDIRKTFSAIRPEARFEPSDSAGADKDIVKAQKAWIEKDVKSPYFKKWFKGSKVVDDGGNPKIVYHGTTHEFDRFTMDRANPENAFGRGYYFTDDPNDASGNYEGLGPDLKNRVDQRVERLQSENEDLSEERARHQAMDELVGNSDRTIEAYIKLENPAVIKKNGGTEFEYHFDEDTGEETGTAIDLIQAIISVAPEFGVDPQELWAKISANGAEVSARDVHSVLKGGDFYPEDPKTGALATGELTKEIFKRLGYDGIILHNAEEEYPGMHLGTDTTHYIAFDPTQVKAVQNRGTFSKTDPRYNFEPQKSEQPFYSQLDRVIDSKFSGREMPAPEMKNSVLTQGVAQFEPSKFNTKGVAKDIWDKAKQGGGFTYNPYSRKFLTTGYAASIYPDKEISQVIDPKELTQETLENFIEDRKHLLTRAENSVGGWLDPESGKLYLDVAFTTPSRPLAEFAGRQFNQKAIGDLAKYAAGENGDIATGGTGEPIENLSPAHTRVDELLKDYAWEQPDLFGDRPQQELMPGIGSRAPLTSKEVGDMTKAELMRHYPEGMVPKRRKDLIDYDIKDAPRWKGNTDLAADELEKFSKSQMESQEFRDGLKWYSEFVPMLKKAYGKSHEMMAQLLAATSPRNSPTPNFALSNDALEGYKSGRFDKQIKKYLDGAKMLESGTWKSWYAKQKKAGKLVAPKENPSDAAFMAEWIDAHNLAPRQSNGKLYGMHSVPVLQVMAGKWLTENTGPKTLQFVKNLLGVHHGATIDVWAARTMRRLGHEGISDRWRILPGNETGVSDTDFKFSQEAFEKAASRLGVKPDALQGALWFAEKKLWAERGWGRLDFGDFRKEIAKREMLNQGIKARLAASGKSTATQESLLDLVTPRNER